MEKIVLLCFLMAVIGVLAGWSRAPQASRAITPANAARAASSASHGSRSNPRARSGEGFGELVPAD